MSEVEAGFQAPDYSWTWDPTMQGGKGGNVYTPEGSASYVATHSPNYQGYSGSTNVINNTRIHPEAYGVQTGTHQEAPGWEGQRASYERMNMNPNNPYETSQYGEFTKKAANAAQIAPGVRYNLGFIPGGYGGYDMAAFHPLNWDAEYQDPTGNRNRDEWGANPFETKYLNTLSQHNFNSPTFMQMQEKQGHPGQMPNFGRGFHYEGQASAEEAQMMAALDAGQPVDFNRFAQLRNARIKQNELSTMQKIGQKYWAPFITAAATAPVGLAGGVMGPIAGGALGAFGQGAMTGFKNPMAIAAGALGGAAGGWGGGQLATQLGLGPIAGQALTGAAGSLGGGFARQAVEGKFDPAQLLRNAAISGGVGAGIGAFSPSRIDPNTGVETRPAGPLNFGKGPGYTIPIGLGGNVIGGIANQYLPGGPQPPQRPKTPQQLAQERERQRRMQMQQRQLNPYTR